MLLLACFCLLPLFSVPPALLSAGHAVSLVLVLSVFSSLLCFSSVLSPEHSFASSSPFQLPWKCIVILVHNFFAAHCTSVPCTHALQHRSDPPDLRCTPRFQQHFDLTTIEFPHLVDCAVFDSSRNPSPFNTGQCVFAFPVLHPIRSLVLPFRFLSFRAFVPNALKSPCATTLMFVPGGGKSLPLLSGPKPTFARGRPTTPTLPLSCRVTSSSIYFFHFGQFSHSSSFFPRSRPRRPRATCSLTSLNLSHLRRHSVSLLARASSSPAAFLVITLGAPSRHPPGVPPEPSSSCHLLPFGRCRCCSNSGLASSQCLRPSAPSLLAARVLLLPELTFVVFIPLAVAFSEHSSFQFSSSFVLLLFRVMFVSFIFLLSHHPPAPLLSFDIRRTTFIWVLQRPRALHAFRVKYGPQTLQTSAASRSVSSGASDPWHHAQCSTPSNRPPLCSPRQR